MATEKTKKYQDLQLLYVVFQILSENRGGLPVGAVLGRLQKYVDEWELPQDRNLSGQLRWKTRLHWVTNDCVRGGLLVKSNRYWKLTATGRLAASLSETEFHALISRKGKHLRDIDKDRESFVYQRERPISRGGMTIAPESMMMLRTTRPEVVLQDYVVQKVFYGTNRNKLELKPRYGTGRSVDSKIFYGECDVSIPSRHRRGKIESPSILRFEFKEDPNKHVVLLETTEKEQGDFFSSLVAGLREEESNQAFVFFHGYNVTFEGAAKRTAQMAYDLEFKGAPIFFSWPSLGTIPGYPTDSANIEWAKTAIKQFLYDVIDKSTAEKIYLIAHSMGNRGVLRALQDIAQEKPEYAKKITEVILAAPDIDADIFENEIAPALQKVVSSITLYASSEDKALAVSEKFNGHRRAGDTKKGVVITPGVETIDATHANTSLSFLGHSYYGDKKSVLSDIFYLISKGLRAASRYGLKKVTDSGKTYWEITK